MPEISTEEVTTIENTLVTIREAISQAGDNSPEVQKIMEMIIEAEQICASKLDETGDATAVNNSSQGTPSQSLNK